MTLPTLEGVWVLSPPALFHIPEKRKSIPLEGVQGLQRLSLASLRLFANPLTDASTWPAA